MSQTHLERLAIVSLLLFILWNSLKTYSANPQSVETVSSSLSAAALSTCVPHIPIPLLAHTSIPLHPKVLAALARVDKLLQDAAKCKSDAFSLAIVHASSPDKLYEFYNGHVRTNETKSEGDNLSRLVDGDSIFRIASVTKMFVVLEMLRLMNLSHASGASREHVLTPDTRLIDVMPEFRLPGAFSVEREGITLAMLGSHRAGIPRDVGLLLVDDLGDVTYPPLKAGGYMLSREGRQTPLDGGGQGIRVQGGDFKWPPHPSNRTILAISKEELIELIGTQDLIFSPGEMPSYSNTGFVLLGFALEAYNKGAKGTNDTFADLATRDIIKPLNMTNSFFGVIPDRLQEHITVPNVDHMVDLLFSQGDDPAGGMWSSTNDLLKYLHSVLLSPSPELISTAQRQVWLRSVYSIPDGVSSVGMPWEIRKLSLIDQAPEYKMYTKGGMLPGHYSLISVIPELGYGIVSLSAIGTSQEQIEEGGVAWLNPGSISLQVHNVLAPAFLTAYQDLLVDWYVGVYKTKHGIAVVKFEDGILWLRKFILEGVDVLLKLDELAWLEAGRGERRYGNGAKLTGTGYEGVFRAAPGVGCSWGSFDSYTTENGWGIDKIVFQRGGDEEMEIVYEPLKARLVREQGDL